MAAPPPPPDLPPPRFQVPPAPPPPIPRPVVARPPPYFPPDPPQDPAPRPLAPAPPAAAGPYVPPPRPNSPWFEKYGGRSESILKFSEPVTNHSGFAPMLPFVSPEAPVRRGMIHMPQPRPDDDDLDKVFATERQQKEWNSGLTTWETVVMNKFLLGDRKDDEVLNRWELLNWGLVQVDEDTWNPVFKRDKWFNLRRRVLNPKYFDRATRRRIQQRLELNPGTEWSVDVHGIWREFRLPLELANRWLGYMAKGPWLNNVVHRAPVLWSGAQGNELFMTDSGDKIFPHKINEQEPVNLPAQTLAFISTHVANRIVWRFVDEETYDDMPRERWISHYDGRTTVRAAGRPVGGPGGPRYSAVCVDINVQPLRVLINPNTTLADRSMATVKLAATILRELTGVNDHEKYETPDPLYGWEWISDLGKSGMASFFGCDIIGTPSPDSTHAPGAQIGLHAYDFPDPQWKLPRLTSIRPRGHMAPWQDFLGGVHFETIGFQTSRSPLLGAWVSSLLREDFYTHVADQIGLRAFWAPRVLAADCYYQGVNTNVNPGEFPTIPEMYAMRDVTHPRLYRRALDTMNELHQVRERWKANSPWRDNLDFNVWNRSPYSMVSARAAVERFMAIYTTSKPMYHDAMTIYQRGGLNRNELEELDDNRNAPVNMLPPNTWFFTVLACLMAAVLPRRAQNFNGPARYRWYHDEPWFRSNAYSNSVRELPLNTHNVFSFADGIARQKQWAYPGWKDYGRVNLIKRKQTHRLQCIWAAQELMNSFETFGYPLPQSLWQALRDEVTRFTQQFLMPGPQQKRAEEWADFNFVFPPFRRDDLEVRPREADGPLVLYVPPLPPDFAGDEGAAGDVNAGVAQARMAQIRTKDASYDIYDLTPIRAADRTLTNPDIFEARGELGYTVIKPGRARNLIRSFQARNAISPVGKLVMARHIQEVAERDGVDGRELWCVIGHWIYNLKKADITDEERETLISLQRYVYKEVGMYCAIAGKVYDLAPYLHSHPGGAQILKWSAGKDVTNQFQQSHTNWEDVINQCKRTLRVGNLVPVPKPEDPPEYDWDTLPEITEATFRARPRRTDGKYPDTARLAVFAVGRPLNPARPGHGWAIVYDVTPILAFGEQRDKRALRKHLNRSLPNDVMMAAEPTMPWVENFREHKTFAWAKAKVILPLVEPEPLPAEEEEDAPSRRQSGDNGE
ncbi:hypothetical protein QBC43DRAFT_221119 [Cladorrhinum sp. PSN259]|nr:hypothetical protein QBC43DRAFT_221119 [Cladorrhinum sp. PSN259]